MAPHELKTNRYTACDIGCHCRYGRVAFNSVRAFQSREDLGNPAKPLMLEKNEGEQRTWRPEAGESDLGGFGIKASPKNNGSRHLVLLTDDMAPGNAIPTHKHLGQDEIVFVEKGTIHVHMGNQEGDLHAGGTVFIPAYTWVNVKNIGTDPVSSVTIFSASGFEDHLRCESALANEKPATIFRKEENECDHMGHVVYQDRGEKDPGSGTTTPNTAKPLLLEKDEGERRTWRDLPPGEFILKVSPKTTALSTLSWELKTWFQETKYQPTSTLGRMKFCISKKEPLTFISETRNAICTREEWCSFRRIPG